jgi:MmyB-like transcription regulator ligand binding domain/Helix-turn-helix domain
MPEVMTLASVLRAWRERISPADAGFPGGRGSRRVPGLRREELAWLASISPDYIKRLEQGRAHPGSDVVRALARALRLSQEEYELLSRLAGHAGDRAGQVPRHVTPGAQRLADRMNDVPLGIYDATWTLLSWNQPWVSLIGDPGAAHGRDRNLVWLYFTGASLRIQHADPGRHEDEIVADLREAVSRYPGDEELAALVRDLRGVSERFAARWEQPAVARIRSERKTVHNPVVGDITLDCDVLTIHGNDLRVVVFTAAPGTPDADKLAMLSVVGDQDFSGSGTE